LEDLLETLHIRDRGSPSAVGGMWPAAGSPQPSTRVKSER
jgi:hypothetical protein